MSLEQRCLFTRRRETSLFRVDLGLALLLIHERYETYTSQRSIFNIDQSCSDSPVVPSSIYGVNNPLFTIIDEYLGGCEAPSTDFLHVHDRYPVHRKGVNFSISTKVIPPRSLEPSQCEPQVSYLDGSCQTCEQFRLV